ncbi:hypothetical protein HMPREF9441_02919 [Paraprevotella clara YIT 11840]|uniref:Uncharacterized protein n=1 Tax=Paraprevotella clara YIT 11840 TaxID=762968 RepID=G5SU64_9BACT|nr:hypothetical protein HMPREF9441_02919 [Paraprevotella clara YIT 11840]
MFPRLWFLQSACRNGCLWCEGKQRMVVLYGTCASCELVDIVLVKGYKVQ